MRKTTLARRVTWCLVWFLGLLGLGGSGPEVHKAEPAIGVIGSEHSLQRVDEALQRMGERFSLIEVADQKTLERYDLVLNRGAFANNDAAIADNHARLLEYVVAGGCLLVFEMGEFDSGLE